MKRLKELREAKHLSQQNLGMKLNVSQAMISKYELGSAQPDYQMLKKIANFFNVTTDYLLENSDNKIAISTNLSETEKELIYDFKRLDKTQKEKAQAYIKGLLQE